MSTPIWETSCSVEVEAGADFAWRYWTDIAHWDDPPSRFELEGPFAAGSAGMTCRPGEPPIRWQITRVSSPSSYTMEVQLDRATLEFEWRFEPLPHGRTRLTQRIALTGENAGVYSDQMEAGFRETLPAGMRRIAALISRAASSAR